MATKGIAMQRYDLFSNETDLYEMKPGWVIRLVPGENPLMSRYRHGPAIMIGMMIVGTGMQMYSQYQQGKQAQEIAEKNAQMMKNKALQEKARGDQAAQLAQDKATLKQKQANIFEAEQQKDLAAGNIKLGVGISNVIKADTREKAAKEVGYIMDEGYNQKRALYEESRTSLMQADIFKEEGANARRNNYWSMATTGLGAASSMAFMGSDMGWFGGGGGSTMPGGPNSAGDRARP